MFPPVFLSALSATSQYTQEAAAVIAVFVAIAAAKEDYRLRQPDNQNADFYYLLHHKNAHNASMASVHNRHRQGT